MQIQGHEVPRENRVRRPGADEEGEEVHEGHLVPRRPLLPELDLPAIQVAPDDLIGPGIDDERQAHIVSPREGNEAVHAPGGKLQTPGAPGTICTRIVRPACRRLTQPEAWRSGTSFIGEQRKRHRAAGDRVVPEPVSRPLLGAPVGLHGMDLAIRCQPVPVHLVIGIRHVEKDYDRAHLQSHPLQEVPGLVIVDHGRVGADGHIQHLDRLPRPDAVENAGEGRLVRHPDALGERVAEQKHTYPNRSEHMTILGAASLKPSELVR